LGNYHIDYATCSNRYTCSNGRRRTRANRDAEVDSISDSDIYSRAYGACFQHAYQRTHADVDDDADYHTYADEHCYAYSHTHTDVNCYADGDAAGYRYANQHAHADHYAAAM
jgi:hypothetical protein